MLNAQMCGRLELECVYLAFTFNLQVKYTYVLCIDIDAYVQTVGLGSILTIGKICSNSKYYLATFFTSQKPDVLCMIYD